MNKKGITMVSLVFYILSFLTIVSIIGSINIYISKNIDLMNTETDAVYAQNQLDKYLRKFINRKDKFEIRVSDINNSDYIMFTRKNIATGITETNTIRFYSKSPIENEGIIFLEVKEDSDLKKKIVIAENIIDLSIINEELALGKTLTFEIDVKKGDKIETKVLSYGIER